MKSERKAVIVGVADLPLTDGMLFTPLQVQSRAAHDARKDCGFAMSEVDGGARLSTVPQ